MGVTYDQPTLDGICGRLRQLVQDSFQKHLYTTAVFYADKLLSLSNGPEELYTLAECYFKNREYRRVLHLLKKHGDRVSKDQRLKLLVVQSLMECRDWEECLRYLEANTTTDPLPVDEKMSSAFALLRAKVYEVTENVENALTWYERALQLDPYCHEAIDRLVGNHLLTAEKEVALLSSLRLHEGDEWLRHMYAAKLAAVRGGGSSSDAMRSYGLAPPDALQSACRALAPAPSGLLPTSSLTPLHAVAAAAQAVPAVDLAAGGNLEQLIWRGRARQRRLQQAISDGAAFVLEEYPTPWLPAALVMNGHTLAAQSTCYFSEGDYESCYIISKRVLDDDPYHFAVLPVHIACLVMLGMKSAVFYVAHQLVNAYPTSAVAWFTAGCYYFMVKKYEHARRFFHKAISLEQGFAPAWIAYGHAFAQHDESDQALAAYRTASRLFPGSHLPWLFIGMEYVRTNSMQLAQQCLDCAATLVAADPHVFNELAVVAFQKRDYSRAIDLLLQSLRLPGAPLDVICSNLGHAFLKCKAYDRALEAFRQANKLSPRTAPALAGMAFTLQLQGRVDEAIDCYHHALGVQRDNAFCSEMLNYAVQEAAERIMDL